MMTNRVAGLLQSEDSTRVATTKLAHPGTVDTPFRWAIIGLFAILAHVALGVRGGVARARLGYPFCAGTGTGVSMATTATREIDI